jgi:hypothetical protein
MKRLSKEEYILQAKHPLISLFGTEIPDPFIDPFFPKVERKLIIAGSIPNKDLLDAIKVTATRLGDNGFFMCNPPRRTRQFTYSDNWYIPFKDISKYKSETLVEHFEYTYYSPQGVWGLVTCDVHGILGGTENFIHAICQIVPDIENDVIHSVRYWLHAKTNYPERVDIEWLHPMLVSIYGNARANKLLNDRGFTV